MKLSLNRTSALLSTLLLGCVLTLAAHATETEVEPQKGTAATFGKNKPRPGEKLMSRDELRTCLKLDADQRTTTNDVVAEQKKLNALAADIKKTTADNNQTKEKLDPADEAAGNAYKAAVQANDKRIDEYNALLPKFNQMVENYEGMRKTWKETCADKPYDEYDFFALKKQERDAAKKAAAAEAKDKKAKTKKDAAATKSST